MTKSAVTQMSIKLLDKGLIEKFQDSKNKKEKYFRLTNEGKKARETYMAHHDQALNEMRAYLCSLNENDEAIYAGVYISLSMWHKSKFLLFSS